jgi:hypothetical protein
MFRVSKLSPDTMWAAREGVSALRDRMNARARRMITEWLDKKGVAVVEGPGARVKRRDTYLRRKLQGGPPAFAVAGGAAPTAGPIVAAEAAAMRAAGALRGAAAQAVRSVEALLPRPSRK